MATLAVPVCILYNITTEESSRNVKALLHREIQRYRLEVMVYHKEECTNFLLWDRECANLIGQSDDEVNRLKIADGDVDLNVYLEALDKILGYTLAFKVKVQSKFRNFVVLKYSFDSDLINTTIDLLPDIEAPYKVHFPLSDTNDPLQYETIMIHFSKFPLHQQSNRHLRYYEEALSL
ncbi:hypothetical protein JHK84_050020 [Glycine max]|nr:hypothetical protein JHK84_050020 [Glycine max]